MARLVLVGLPGVGKSTLGQALAEQWSCALIDIDTVIAEDVTMPVAQFLQEKGEDAFREREVHALSRALSVDAVVATGAGIVVSKGARDLLEGESVVWLDCANATLVERVADGERPLLGTDHGAGVARLRGERETLYESVATLRIDASGSVDDVLERILAALLDVER